MAMAPKREVEVRDAPYLEDDVEALESKLIESLQPELNERISKRNDT